MKKLLNSLVIFFALFLTVSGQEQEDINIDSTIEIGSVQKINIDSTTIETFSGTTFQTVYYKDGTAEIFTSYLHIEDISLRINYLTHRNLNRKVLQKCNYDEKVDYGLFIKHLISQDQRPINYEEYKQVILNKEASKNWLDASTLTENGEAFATISGILVASIIVMGISVLGRYIRSKSTNNSGSTELNTG